MLDLVVVALLQAAAGDPAQPPQNSSTQAQQQAESAQSAEEEAAERRRCRSRQVTGTRLQSLVQCRTRGNGQQDQNTREALHDIQRPSGLQGN